jgi:hypothetical protein
LALSEASEPGILERAETPFQSQNFLLFGHIFNFEYDELKLTIKEVVDNNKVRLTGSLAFGQDIDNANFFKSVWLSWKGEMRKGRRTFNNSCHCRFQSCCPFKIYFFSLLFVIFFNRQTFSFWR